ncbi:hypothetical protein Patl1_00800 [Pistacia atlantica]|uniref:Uncharacterized protein n=1 Tax=Pistacia atlantica TaxID=434234 RepID=A0ACC1C4R4_9ROSI|nr:hypothetical protein Patl1_00800 [Pistacia atlantica]
MDVRNHYPFNRSSAWFGFCPIYKESYLFRKNKEQVRELSQSEKSSKELHFPTRFPQNEWEQFKACLWKQHLTYWRSPKYNLVRLTFTTLIFLDTWSTSMAERTEHK